MTLTRATGWQSINKSLSALGDVFTAISKKQNHVHPQPSTPNSVP